MKRELPPFTVADVGKDVWSPMWGWGKVISVDYNLPSPISVKFKVFTFSLSKQGTLCEEGSRVLFREGENAEYEVPPPPFQLVPAYRLVLNGPKGLEVSDCYWLSVNEYNKKDGCSLWKAVDIIPSTKKMVNPKIEFFKR